jgi:hypothetical protein
MGVQWCAMSLKRRSDCMSVLGHSRPNWPVRAMSGFPPLATDLQTSVVVRFVPTGDIPAPKKDVHACAHLSGLIQSAVKFICNAFALFGAEIRHNCQILDMVRDGRPKGEIFRENGLAIREQ